MFTAGGQRVEKVANTAALRKQEVRVAHLEAALASLTKQVLTLSIPNPALLSFKLQALLYSGNGWWISKQY